MTVSGVVVAVLCTIGVAILLHTRLLIMRDTMYVMCGGDQTFFAVEMRAGPVLTGNVSQGSIDRDSLSIVPFGSARWETSHKRI